MILFQSAHLLDVHDTITGHSDNRLKKVLHVSTF